MDAYAKLIIALRAAVQIDVLPLINAVVTAVDGESCTVMYGELELTDVRLMATINGEDNRLLLVPKVGSMVLIGSLTGDLKDLAVLRVDELERMSYVQDGLKVELDSTDGKIKVENESTSLKALFQELTDLLKQFKVLTPSGPSSGLVPDTLTAITQFETDFKTLLK